LGDATSTTEAARFVNTARAPNSRAVQVEVLGDVAAATNASSSSSTIFGVVAALLVLLFVFGSVLPALLPLCSSSVAASPLTSQAAIPIAVAALALHTAAMLATIAVISLAVYNWIGVGFLRRGWINLDLVWIAALLACGIALLMG